MPYKVAWTAAYWGGNAAVCHAEKKKEKISSNNSSNIRGLTQETFTLVYFIYPTRIRGGIGSMDATSHSHSGIEAE